MPIAIPETIKLQVVTQWLQALSRNAIAQQNNISTGAVSNIINEQLHALGRPEAHTMRELANSLRLSVQAALEA